MTHPPLPWRLQGTLITGLLPAAPTTPLPHGLTDITPRHTLLYLAHYTNGDILYSGLTLLRLVRKGRHIGTFSEECWFDHPAAQHVVAEQWGMSTSLMTCQWGKSSACMTSETGEQCEINFDNKVSGRLRVPVKFPLYGDVDDKLIRLAIGVSFKPTRTHLTLTAWPASFPPLRHTSTHFGILDTRMKITAPV
ncbi:hypothetical protein [Streptomyces syringium]|uniref:hypothetical protein n=1 Tax=Streptomyces syringium TaxID=76729 RepID=UPI0034523885